MTDDSLATVPPVRSTIPKVNVAVPPTDHVIRFTSAPVAPILKLAAAIDGVRSAVHLATRRSVWVDGVRFHPPRPGGSERVIHLRTTVWDLLAVPMLLRRGGTSRLWDPFALEFLVDRDPASIPTPSILVGFHTEPVAGFVLLLASLNVPTTILLAGPTLLKVSETLGNDVAVVEITETDDAGRSAAFLTAARNLRAGGIVLLLADGVGTSQVPTAVLGRPMTLAAGAFALSRISGAPLVPLTTRWHGARPHLSVGEPIPSAGPAEMADALGQWLERYLRSHPGELTPYHAESLGLQTSWSQRLTNTAIGLVRMTLGPVRRRLRGSGAIQT